MTAQHPGKVLCTWLIFFLTHSLLAQDSTQTDTARFTPPNSFSDTVLHLSLSLFTSNQRVSALEKDGYIAQDLSGYVKLFRVLDLSSSGGASQPRTLSLLGIPSGNLGIYSGKFFFNPPGLGFPFQTRGELASFGADNIESVQLVESPLINLVLADSKLGGVYVEEKRYRSPEPYSRFTFEQGQHGYRRTQVELGRSFAKRLSFYGTLGIRKYDGNIPNTDQNLDNYAFKLGYELNPKTSLEGDLQFYSGKRGLVPFSGWENYNIRHKESHQKLNLTLYRQLSQKQILKAGFIFNRVEQNLNPPYRKSIDKAYGVQLEIYPRTLGRNSTRLKFDSFKFDYRDQVSHSLQKDNFSLTNLLRINPQLWWLAWGNFEGYDTSGFFVSDRKLSFLTGLAYKPASSLKIYSSGGRINTYPTSKEFFSPGFGFPATDSTAIYYERGDSTLKSGYNWYVQSGVDWESKDLKLGTFYYFSNSKREIVAAKVDSLPYGSWFPVNSDFRVRGVNAYLDLRPRETIRLYANWNRKTWEKGKASYLPKSSLFSFLEVNQEFFKNQLGWKARLESEYLGVRRDENDTLLKETLVLNSKFTFRILAVHFYFVVENLNNQIYRSGSQFNLPRRTTWWGVYWEFFD